MRAFACLACVAVLLVAVPLYADSPRPIGAVPRVISFQAKLTDSNGIPETGMFKITARLWDSETGGNMLSEETHDSVDVDNEGLYNVGVSIPGGVAFNQPLWLGIEVESDGEMTPRYRLTSSPYSFWAMDADMVDGHDADEFVSGSGEQNYIPKFTGSKTLGKSVCYESSNTFNINDDLRVTGKATIGPGCTSSGNNTFVAGRDNIANGNYATVAGGWGNAGIFEYVSLGGGCLNTASARYATVGGGYADSAAGTNSVIAGGGLNKTAGASASIGGGYRNVARNQYATVGGGHDNTASNTSATVAGGDGNVASGGYATVGGGARNTASSSCATIAGGYTNTASGSWCFVGGGHSNRATKDYATVAGGVNNTVSGSYATVGGGKDNTASDYYATVGGGSYNIASGDWGTVGGGNRNTAMNFATVGGGYVNSAWHLATVAGGAQNQAASAYTVVGGGAQNTASDSFAIVAGGLINSAGAYAATVGGGYADTVDASYAFAAGRKVRIRSGADHTFAFGYDFATSTSNAAVFHRAGGPFKLGVGRANPAYYIHVGPGAYCDGTQWVGVSSKTSKRDIQMLDARDYEEILKKLDETEVVRYRYKAQDDDELHIGVIAEDAPEEIVDQQRKGVRTGDAIGFLLAALKAQQEQIQSLRVEIERLKSRQ